MNNMKSFNYKALLRSILIFISILFLVIANLLYFLSVAQQSVKKQHTTSGYLHLTDSYDSEKSSILNFYEEENSIDILYSMYDYLMNQNDFTYYIMDEQPLEYIDRFTGSIDLVDGFDESFINQINDEGYLTPLKSIQMNQNSIDLFQINEKIADGRFFDLKYNYNFDHQIPVILGNNYRDLFQINDTFKTWYLGQKIIECRVVGFLETETVVEWDEYTYELDNYIIMPYIHVEKNVIGNKDALFYKIYLTQKCEGYMYYNNKEEFSINTQLINERSTEYGFQYRDFGSLNENTNTLPIGICRFILVMSYLFYFFILFIYYQIYKKNEVKNNDIKNLKDLTILNIMTAVKTSLLIALSYTLSYFLVDFLVNRYFKMHILSTQPILRIFLIISTMIFSYIMIRLNKKTINLELR